MRDPRRWRATEVVKEAAKENRRKPTEAERALWAMLRDGRCDAASFRRQAPRGPFILDFYCPAASLSIEADGGIHGNETVARRDAERQRILEEVYGIRVLRFTNEEILKNPEYILSAIKTALREQQP